MDTKSTLYGQVFPVPPHGGGTIHLIEHTFWIFFPVPIDTTSQVSFKLWQSSSWCTSHELLAETSVTRKTSFSSLRTSTSCSLMLPVCISVSWQCLYSCCIVWNRKSCDQEFKIKAVPCSQIRGTEAVFAEIWRKQHICACSQSMTIWSPLNQIVICLMQIDATYRVLFNYWSRDIAVLW